MASLGGLAWAAPWFVALWAICRLPDRLRPAALEAKQLGLELDGLTRGLLVAQDVASLYWGFWLVVAIPAYLVITWLAFRTAPSTGRGVVWVVSFLGLLAMFGVLAWVWVAGSSIP